MDVREIQAEIVAGLRRTGAEFENIQPGRAAEFVEHVASAYGGLLAAKRRLPEQIVSEPREKGCADRYGIAWHLLWGAVNSMTAAWALLERGFPTEPLVVARQAMEKLACAIVLFDNPTLVPRFNAGKLGTAFATRCITPVGRVVPDFGRTYGLLTELGAHVAPDVVSLPFVPASAPETLPTLAAAGDFRTEGPGKEYWAEIAGLFCAIARDILKPSAEKVFFRTRRTAVLDE